jgi:hypothetical protein
MNCTLRGATVLGVLGAAAIIGLAGAAQAQGEKSLLGVRIWDSKWRDVLAKHGQPTRIEVGAVTSGGAEAGAAGGGMPGMGGMGGMPGRGLPGVGGMGPGMGMPGMPGSGGKMGMMGGTGMGMPMGGAPGMPGSGGRTGMGMPGMPGGFRMPGSGGGMGALMGGEEGGGMPGGPGMPGMGGAPGMGGEQASTPEEEVTWVYERKGKSPLTDFFLFNRDGRLIQAGSFGYSGGAVTSRGVRLGDPVGKIYGVYGWTGDMIKDAARSTMTLDYSKSKNVAFQLLDRHDGRGFRVVGITVGLTDKSNIPGNRTEESAR